ncbi:MAG TPA: transglycosylase domain-containing protein [Burkholderiaceae bacterium]|nr:transglycosylase domain-containing protein [Burkholderiaceae bacterium]
MTTTDPVSGQQAHAMNDSHPTTTRRLRLAARLRSLRLRPVLRGLALGIAVLAGFAGVLAMLVMHALAPAPGEWSTRLRVSTPLGALERSVSVPVLLRWAFHPLAARLLEGRDWSAGAWRLHIGAAGEMQGECRPCALQLEALGPEPLRISQAHWQLQRIGPETWQGRLRLGETSRMLDMVWRAQLRSDGMEIHAELPPAPLADALALFAEAVPEAQRAQVDGSLSLKLDARWGPQGLRLVRLVPRLEGVRVAGLGTEALIDAAAPATCTAPALGRVDGWLPKAVVAALDPRFYDRVGDELDLGQPAQAGAPGGSLSARLARLLYTGEARGQAQSLREWLYAAEMERTLGKGRILQTYLALAPWGAGVCGAEAASRHHLGKPAERLTPREAAWLASRLLPVGAAGQ